MARHEKNLAMVSAGDFATDAQPQALSTTTSITGTFGAMEAIENTFMFFLGNLHACVADGEYGSFLFDGEFRVNFTVGHVVFDRVVEKVQQQLPKELWFAINDHFLCEVGLEHDCPRRGKDLHILHQIFEHGAEIDGPELQ